ncbi:MAG: MFS transporter [Elusimicrobiota bacterium]|jgi:POT family proton-dependent oligopeptide transporter|nr:MFS transporter [Elusimicrobiota bacterium]
MEQTEYRQPAGLWVIAAAQACERGAYYMMRAVLVLHLVYALKMQNHEAAKIYGFFTAANMMGGSAAGVLGGFLGDLVGHKPMALISGILIAAGLFIMGGGSMGAVMCGLGLLAAGGGIFRVATHTLAGLLYPKNDARRDGGFTYLYLAVNLGAFAGPFLIGRGDNFVMYFRMAGFIMLAGIILFAVLSRFIKPADTEDSLPAQTAGFNGAGFAAVAALTFAVILLSTFIAEAPADFMNVFVRESTERIIGRLEIPASWFQIINPLFTMLLAFIMPWIYIMRAAKGKNNTAGRLVWSFILSAAGCAVMLVAAAAAGAGKVTPLFIITAYAAFAAAELFIMPVLFSLITNNAPQKHAGMFVGTALLIWRLVATGLGRLLTIYSERITQGTPAAFGLLLAAALCSAAVTYGLVKLLKPYLNPRN